MAIHSRYSKCKTLVYDASYSHAGEVLFNAKQFHAKDSLEPNQRSVLTKYSVEYRSRRFIPQPHNYKIDKKVLIKQGERLDLSAQDYLGGYASFWAIVDINRTMNPFELMHKNAIGAYLKVPSPLSVAFADGGIATLNQSTF